MSGLVAIVHHDTKPVSPALLDAMTRRLVHRGPDENHVWHDASVGLGHCLLAVTEEDSLQQQPLHCAESDCRIVADARIDNRAQLIDTLGLHPGLSDAGLILETYKQWGEVCAAKLLGDFAFVIWDAKKRSLLCARDHMGVRPLYYGAVGRTFRAASELHAFFADADLPRRPNRAMMGMFLVDKYIECPETLYEGLLSIRPAHAIVSTKEGTRDIAYWKPNPWSFIRYSTPRDYENHYRSIFDEAVRCRLRAAHPVASEVSGGHDSGSIVAAAECLRRAGRTRPEPLTLVHLTMPGFDCDEGSFSGAVGEHWGLPLVEIAPPDWNAFPIEYERVPPDEPWFPGVDFIYAETKELTKRNIRALLSGIGTDDLMRRTGYEIADPLSEGQWASTLEAAGITSNPWKLQGWKKLVTQGVRPLLPRTVMRLMRTVRGGAAEEVPSRPWLSAETNNSIAEQWSLREREKYVDQYPSRASRELCHMLATDPNFLFTLKGLDRIAMRSGVEFRYPFLDLRLVEYLVAIPNSERSRADWQKGLLAGAMGPDLPAKVRTRRPDRGGTSFHHNVLFAAYGETVRKLASDSRLVEWGLVDSKNVRIFWERAATDSTSLVDAFNFVGLELWVRRNYCPPPIA